MAAALMFGADREVEDHLCDRCRAQQPCAIVTEHPLRVSCWTCDGKGCSECGKRGVVDLATCPTSLPAEAWDACHCASLLQLGISPWSVPFLELPMAVRAVFSFMNTRYSQHLADARKPKAPPIPTDERGDASAMFRDPKNYAGVQHP